MPTLKRLLQTLLIGGTFLFLGRSIYHDWQRLPAGALRVSYVHLALSFIGLVLTLIGIALTWRAILLRLGGRLGVREALHVWFLSNLGRYLPGRLWQFAGLVYLSEREGVPKALSGTSMAMTQVLSILASLLLIVPYVALRGDAFMPGLRYSLILFVPVAVALVYPPVLQGSINAILRRLRRREISIEMGFADLARFTVLFLVGWIAYGLVFYLFADALSPLPASRLPSLAAMFATSYTAGLLSVITPGGLGVREAVLTAMLSAEVPLALASTISILSRVWFTLAELTCLGIVLLRTTETQRHREIQ